MADISEVNVLRASYDSSYPYESDWDGMKATLAVGRVSDTSNLGLINVEGLRVCPVEFGVVTTVLSPEVEFVYNPKPVSGWERTVRLVGDAMLLPNLNGKLPKIREDRSFEISVVGGEKVADLLARLTDPNEGSELPFRFFRNLYSLTSRRLNRINAHTN